MEYLALVLSIVSLTLYRELRKEMIQRSIIVEKSELAIPKESAILFKPKKPEQKRFEKKLKQGKDLNIDEIC